MRYEIMGFNQSKIIELNLNLKEVLLLNYVIDAIASPTMEHKVQNGVAYVWLKHDRILKDLPILSISERSLIDYLNKLKDLDLLDVFVVHLESGRGSKSYYSITEKCESLKYDQVQKIAVSQRPSAENCNSDNISNSNSDIRDNTQQSLFTDNINNSKKEDMSNKVQEFINNYNAICKSLPKCQRTTTKRSKGIANILKKFSQQEIIQVFNNLETSDFCKGNNNRGWRASIDFILNEEKFIKTLEGAYNNHMPGCSVETISSNGPKYRVSAEEKENMRRAVERGEIEEY